MAPRGLLFIGDPHITRRCPRHRVDGDFLQTTRNKLAEAFSIAADRDWIPVVLGDLFDRPWENDPGVIGAVLSIFANSRHRPYVLVGNHDCRENRLNPKTSLGVVQASGLAQVIDRTSAWTIPVTDGRLRLGGTPYGHEIPRQVARDDADVVFWVTHEDMAFAGCYPGARDCFAIKGCDYVINGHMHMPAEPVTVGETVWHNPGNIVRLTLPEADRTPVVLGWESGCFERVPLTCRRESFVPKIQASPEAGASPNNAATRRSFAFVQSVVQEGAADRQRSGDAGHLRALIHQVAEKRKTSPAALQIVDSLIDDILSLEES